MPTTKKTVRKKAAVKAETPRTLTAPDLTIDAEQTLQALEEYLRDFLTEAGFDGYIIGLTGGVDSAVAASIAVRAVGKDKVSAFCMPYKSAQHTVKDAQLVADWLGIQLSVIEITKMIDSYYLNPKAVNPVRAGNKMARERMSILFDQAFESRLLVLGYTNRSELSLGYFTWFGDGGCSVCVLGQLYKTQVRQLARYLGVPGEIQQKAPTADLWVGQTDEDELGFSYDEIDAFLQLVIDKGVTSRAALNAAGFDDMFIDRALSLVNKYAFKRKCPSIPALGVGPIPDS
ncbi:MAG TPA: NAD+ synthase, partial [candidate division Zixibacteria bacterium]|nr:NAD+ synthase [candidate division Zixibacteria bacterium]